MFKSRSILIAVSAAALSFWAASRVGASPVCEPAGATTADAPATPDVREAKTSTLVAVRAARKEALCLSQDPDTVRELLSACQGPTTSAPEAAPTWDLALFTGKTQRSLAYWSRERILGERDADGRFRCWPAERVDRLLRDLPVSHPPALPKSPQDIRRRMHRMPKIDGSLPTLGRMVDHAGNVFLGHVVGVSESFYDGAPGHSRQWTSYVVRVVEELKSSRRRPVMFVRLLWPGGYLDGGQVWKYPLLTIGGDYIFFTGGAVREMGYGQRNSWLEDHGEEEISRLNWGWMGFGLLRVKNGTVLPPFDEWEAAMQRYVAAGGKLPEFDRVGPRPIPAWGLALGQYLRNLRLASRR